MRREWSRLHCDAWTNPDFLTLSDQAKLLHLYAETGPHSTSIGCYRLPPSYVAADLRWPLEAVDAALAELEAARFLTRCRDTEWILVTGYLGRNPPENGNVGKSMAGLIDRVPRRSAVYGPLVSSLHCADFRAKFPQDLLDRHPRPANASPCEDAPVIPGRLGVPSPLPFGDPPANPSETVPGTVSEGLDKPSVEPPTAPGGNPFEIQNKTRPNQTQSRACERAPAREADAVGLECLRLCGWQDVPTKNYKPIAGWLAIGADPERDIYPAITEALARGNKPQSLAYFTRAIEDRVKARQAAEQSSTAEDYGEPWQQRLEMFQRSGSWLDRWGPEPGRKGCRVPATLLSEFGLVTAPAPAGGPA